MRVWVFLAAIGAGAPAAAQYIGTAPPPPPPAAPLPGTSETPEAALARNVRLLALAPRSYEALLGAGRAALRLGDAQAAIGFFGRAEEINPVSWVPKWGEGAALVAMEDPQSALGYFEQAQRLGASAASVAADRGLAYDLIGNQAAAQADYRLALGGIDAVEARRRLALSLAVSGDKAGALAALDPLLVRRDPGALRARAFVLALSGDPEGARRAVDAQLPGMSAVFDPFFRKLAGLRPGEKIAAVQFGHFPNGSEQTAAAAAAAAVGVPVRVASPVVAPVIAPVVNMRRDEPLVVASTTVTPPPRARRNLADNSPLDRASVGARTVAPVVAPVLVPVPVEVAPSEVAPIEVAPSLPVASAPVASAPVVDGVRLADLDAVLKRVANAPEAPVAGKPAKVAKPRPDPKIAAKAKAEEKLKAAEALKIEARAKAEAKLKAEAKAAAASKLWVQLAGGARVERMGVEYARIKAKKAALFARRTPWVAELKGWSRLLVGPFKDDDDAQDFINALKGAGIGAFEWTNPAGQVVKQLPAGQVVKKLPAE